MIDEYSLDRTGWARFSTNRRHRYRLARSLTDRPIELVDGIVRAERGVTFVMLNPSTADAFVLDPTIRRCLDFAQKWGADVLQVVNLFSLRSTDPQALYAAENHCDLGEGHLNDGELFAACFNVRVIAAWGAHGAHRDRGKAVRTKMVERFRLKLEHLGRTKDGHPKHPLYLKADTQPEVW